MKPKVNLLLLTLILSLTFSCGEKKDNGSDPEKKRQIPQSESSVEVIRLSDLSLVEVNGKNIIDYAPITGRVVATNSTQLVAEVQGRLVSGSKPFKAGTYFTKGQTLIRVDSREFALNLESQKSAFLNILTAMMPDLKADYPDNYQNWLNYVSSYKSGESLPELPETTSDSEKYFLTSRQVFATYYGIKAQEERLGKYAIRAPFNGSLIETRVDVGGLISPGQPLGTFISSQDYEIEAAVTLRTASTLSIGQQIEFENTENGQSYTATITRINDILDNSTQNIPIFLKVNSGGVRSGLYLQGKLKLKEYADSFKIPADILSRDNTVHILKDSIIRKKKVEILNSNRDSLIVRGFSKGDQLILNTFNNPVSGLKITD